MIQKLKDIRQALLANDFKEAPLWKKTGSRVLQVAYATLRDLTDGQLSLQAMGLVYTTLITLVPLLAISFSVLKGFGVHNQIEPLLLNLLEGLGDEKSQEVSDRVIGFVDNVQVGVLGVLGLGILLYAVIALLQKIEAALNYIWRVGQDRTIAQRFSHYLSVMLMGPFLILMSSGITASVRHSPFIQQVIETAALSSLLDVLTLFVPWLVMAIGFTFIYIYMPNTKVRIISAFIGGLIAAMLWKVMGYLFASFIATSTSNYVAIYAAFATLIILMIWLYASWMVVLIGANISFYAQNPRYVAVSRVPIILSPYLRMAIGLSVLEAIGRAYYNDDKPWTSERLAHKLNVPSVAVQNILNMLLAGGILEASKDDPPRYFPAKPLDATPLQAAVDALEQCGRQGWLQTSQMHFSESAIQAIEKMNMAREKVVTKKTIAETLLGQKKKTKR